MSRLVVRLGAFAALLALSPVVPAAAQQPPVPSPEAPSPVDLPAHPTAAEAAPPAPAAAADDAWDDRFGAPGVTCCAGFNEEVLVARASGGDVYIGGEFTTVGNVAGTSGIARWDGRRWHALGGGLRRETLSGDVYDIAISGSDLYVVGSFDRAGGVAARNIARWNIPTRTWHAVGSGAGPRDRFGDLTTLTAVAAGDGQLYVGGDFRSIDGVAASGVAAWDGARWSALGVGLADTERDGVVITSMLVAGNLVIVGGRFNRAVNPPGLPELPANNIAVWLRSERRWGVLGAGTSATVNALATDGNALYVGGEFTSANGKQVNGIARLEGSDWSALGQGVNGVVRDISFANGTLYVAGSFADASGVPNTNSLATWSGGQWRSLRSDQLLNDPEEQVVSAAVPLPSGELFVAGLFNTSGQPLFRSVAIWDGARWRGAGQGLTDGYVNPGDGYTVAVTPQGRAFIGGDFSEIGGLPFRNLALWDGGAWRDVGGGVDGRVSALLLRGEELYVGGRFTTVGNGVAALNVAKWNTRTQRWSPVGNGLPNGVVNDMVFVGDTLYAGGAGFPSQTECCLWKFDGTVWRPFSERVRTRFFVSSAPTGSESSVYALATDGQRLVVGGVYLDVEARQGGVTTEANGIFIYEPSTDTVRVFGGGRLNDGTGVSKANAPAYVSALAFADGALYIGGSFDNVQRVAAVNIARLDGGGWSALGTGAVGEDARVSALAANGTELYVGGSFEVAGQQAFNIARWNTRSRQWSALGCGIARYDDALSAGGVEALAVQPLGRPNAGLYVAGGFVEAGCKPADGFAIWRSFGAGPLSPRVYLPSLAQR